MAIDDDIALLEYVPTLALLGRNALRVLAIGSESQTLEVGEALFREGEAGDAGYVVEEGVLHATAPGQKHPVELRRGALIGEMALLVATRRPATVIAAEPASVMRIPRALFVKMLQGYPQVAERLHQALLERTRGMVGELGAVRHALDVSEIAQAEMIALVTKSE